jgi:hypothetical protein
MQYGSREHNTSQTLAARDGGCNAVKRIRCNRQAADGKSPQHCFHAGSRIQLRAAVVVEVTMPRTGCKRFEKIQG